MRGVHGSSARLSEPLRRLTARFLLPVLAASALVGVRALPARSAAISDEMPNQTSLDQVWDYGIGGWGNMPGGVASRPYVLSLSVTNGATTTSVISNGTTTPPSTSPGDVTATIEPYNLCTEAQVPGVDPCYSSPNRVSVSLFA